MIYPFGLLADPRRHRLHVRENRVHLFPQRRNLSRLDIGHQLQQSEDLGKR